MRILSSRKRREDAPYNSASISGLGARNIGSATMSGRISAIAGTREPSGKITLFVGAASGGVWKSDDSGTRYRPVFDEQRVQSIGAIALDPKNSKNVWIGTGESWTRNSVSIGESPTAPSASGLFRSTDGGNTWTEITQEANKGFPKKPYGRIAVKIAPSNAQRVYAFVESPESALFVSDDGGATWEKRDKSQWMVWRPFYFANLIVDPKNPDRLFKPDGSLIVSEDGGKSFAVVGGFQGAHGDAHVVWIDPTNTQVVFVGDDGGMWYSYNGGSKWWKGNNLPVSQFYHVSMDDSDPYRVYGGLQDNSSWVGESQYPGGITNAQWENMYNGDGFWMFPDPADPDYIYAEYQGGEIGAHIRRATSSRDQTTTKNSGSTGIRQSSCRRMKKGPSTSAHNFYSVLAITARRGSASRPT